MIDSSPHSLHEQYTGLSDRFRSLWTFYQFLGGVFKHLGRGTLSFRYDFQALYRRLQDALPQIGLEDISPSRRELELIEHELKKIHRELAAVEQEFAPSLLRRFFDHLKRQDQKILFALVKFYLMAETLEQDHLDKLDILLTRLAEAPSLDDVAGGMSDLRSKLDRLAEFGRVPPYPDDELEPSLEEIRQLRAMIKGVPDFGTMMTSGVLDRYRKLKHSLGRMFLSPTILAEIIATNLSAKARFKELYQEEEVRILEDTNRILEIERYVERNPDMAHTELREQIETFKHYRVQYDSGRKDDNVKGDDVLELRQSMLRVLDTFDATTGTIRVEERPPVETSSQDGPFFLAEEEEPEIKIPMAKPQPLHEVPQSVPQPGERRGGFFDPPTEVSQMPGEDVMVEGGSAPPPMTIDDDQVEIVQYPEDETEILEEPLDDALPDQSQDQVYPEAYETPAFGDRPVLVPSPNEGAAGADDDLGFIEEEEAPSLVDLVNPDPLLAQTLQKIAYALEIIDNDLPPEQAVSSQGLHHLRLEPLEIVSYRDILGYEVVKGTMPWEQARFAMLSAALRVKMEEELEELIRLNRSSESERYQQVLDGATQSLERAADVERRYQWFIDDFLYRGVTEQLGLFYRSRFRFLLTYSRLWLEHQAGGGVSPL